MTSTAKFTFIKTLIAKVICHPIVGAIIGFVFGNNIPFQGLRFYTNSNSVSNLSKAYLFWGMYESAEYRFVQKYLLRDVDTIELGSGIGVISSFIARRLIPGKTLVCVEANPDLQDLLRRNLDKYAGHLTTIRTQAVLDCGGSPGEVASFTVNPDHLLSRIRPEGGREIEQSKVSLGHLVKTHCSGPFQLVLDIEGAEASLLEFDSPALVNCKLVVAELHETMHLDRKITVDELRSKFEHLGFRTSDQYGSVYVFQR